MGGLRGGYVADYLACHFPCGRSHLGPISTKDLIRTTKHGCRLYFAGYGRWHEVPTRATRTQHYRIHLPAQVIHLDTASSSKRITRHCVLKLAEDPVPLLRSLTCFRPLGPSFKGHWAWTLSLSSPFSDTRRLNTKAGVRGG